MKCQKAFKSLVVVLSCVGMLSGQIAQAASQIGDVALQPGGRLAGQVLDGQGVAQPHTRVTFLQQGEAVGAAKTDEQGRFVLNGLPAGVYEVYTDASGGVYRLWAPRTAPPAAEDAMLLVRGDTVVRGVVGGGPPPPPPPASRGWLDRVGWLANPWVLGLIVAAAIAIPLAVDDAS